MSEFFFGWDTAAWTSIIWTAALSVIGFRLAYQQSQLQKLIAELELREKTGVILRGADELPGRPFQVHTLLYDCKSVLPIILDFPLRRQKESELLDDCADALCRALEAFGKVEVGISLQHELAGEIRAVVPRLKAKGRTEAANRVLTAVARCS